MQNGTVDRKAIVAIIVLLVLLVALAAGLFAFLNSIEFPKSNIWETVTLVFDWLTTPDEYSPYQILTLDYEIGDAVLRDGWIYFAGLQGNTIRIERMRLDASVVETVAEISGARTMEQIAGFDLALNGTIRLVIRDSGAGGRLLYATYDRAGNLILERELFAPSFFAEDASINRFITSFLADGSMVIDGHDEWTCEVFLYFFGADGTLISRREMTCGTSALTRGGEVIFNRFPAAAVYELDPVTGVWDRQPFERNFTLRRLYTATGDSGFDFYIDINRDDGTSLYGFSPGTEELVHLLHWGELGFRPGGADTMIVASDGQVVLFRQNRSNWRTGTFVLALGVQQAV